LVAVLVGQLRHVQAPLVNSVEFQRRFAAVVARLVPAVQGRYRILDHFVQAGGCRDPQNVGAGDLGPSGAISITAQTGATIAGTFEIALESEGEISAMRPRSPRP